MIIYFIKGLKDSLSMFFTSYKINILQRKLSLINDTV
jgi:hypothetical protein